MEPDPHVHPGIPEVQRVGVALVAIAACHVIEITAHLAADLRGLNASLQDAYFRELREIERTQSLAEEAARARDAALLVRSAAEAAQRFKTFIDRLIAVTDVLPLNSATLLAAQKRVVEQGLTSPDAIVLSSVVGDPKLGEAASCFLNRNVKDFDDPAVVDELTAKTCRVIGAFTGGLEFIKSQLPKGTA